MLPRRNETDGGAPTGTFAVRSVQMFLCILTNLVWAFVAVGLRNLPP